MKKLALLYIIFMVGLVCFGQTWQTINPPKGSFSFDMPGTPDYVETDTTMFYSYAVDTTFVIQTKYTVVQNYKKHCTN